MKFVEFAHIVGKLKELKRSGWLMRKVPNPESVADHSFRTAVLAMFLASKAGINGDKAIKMALIHDLGETEIGDLIIEGEYTNTERDPKLTRERQALVNILSTINAQDHISLFDEFIENKTPEAQFVNQLDKLEAAIQADEYENEYGIDLHEFFNTTKKHLKERLLKEIFSEVIKDKKM